MCVHVFLLKIKFHLSAEKCADPECYGCFDMQFTFVWAGWEGSAHDTRIFLEAIDNPRIKFPKPPEGSNTCLCVSVYMISNVILFFCFCNFQFKTIICFSREILLG
jgi:hypothetical protein